jgi:hypothetical protein
VRGALAGGFSDLLDTITSAAARLWQWGRDLFGAAASTTEPSNAPVRSLK